MSGVKVTGARQARRNLTTLGGIAAQAMEDPAIEAMTIIERETQQRYTANDSVLSGDLRGSLVTQAFRRRKTSIGVETGPTGKGIANAHLIEFGVDPHYQPARNQMHPGHNPFPAMVPATILKEREVLRRLEAGTARNLLRAAARMAR